MIVIVFDKWEMMQKTVRRNKLHDIITKTGGLREKDMNFVSNQEDAF